MRPWQELHAAGLDVKGEVFNVDVTLAFVDGRGIPFHSTVVPHYRFGHDGHGVVAISAGRISKEKLGRHI
jgi:hypothetical protein